MGWTEAWPEPGEVGAGFWSSDAAEEEDAVREAASGGSSEAQEDSTLSTYDNLDRVSKRQRMEDVTGGHDETNDTESHIQSCKEEVKLEKEEQRGDSSSSWSSCEVLPLDESADAVDVVSPDMSPQKPKRLPSSQVADEENGQNEEYEDKINDDDYGEEEEEEEEEDIHHPNSPASCSVLSDSPLSTGSSDVFLPSGPPDPPESEFQSKPGDAHSLLAELRQQMAQQRAEYQARIQR